MQKAYLIWRTNLEDRASISSVSKTSLFQVYYDRDTAYADLYAFQRRGGDKIIYTIEEREVY